jgi:hypothetical protein
MGGKAFYGVSSCRVYMYWSARVCVCNIKMNKYIKRGELFLVDFICVCYVLVLQTAY